MSRSSGRFRGEVRLSSWGIFICLNQSRIWQPGVELIVSKINWRNDNDRVDDLILGRAGG